MNIGFRQNVKQDKIIKMLEKLGLQLNFNGNNKLLGINECAAYLDVTPDTIYKWISRQKIPHIKLGRLIKFDKEKLDNWLKKKSIRSRSSERLDPEKE